MAAVLPPCQGSLCPSWNNLPRQQGSIPRPLLDLAGSGFFPAIRWNPPDRREWISWRACLGMHKPLPPPRQGCSPALNRQHPHPQPRRKLHNRRNPCRLRHRSRWRFPRLPALTVSVVRRRLPAPPSRKLRACSSSTTCGRVLRAKVASHPKSGRGACKARTPGPTRVITGAVPRTACCRPGG